MPMFWKPFHISGSAKARLPPVLISASFRSDSYSIYLTDLAHIWGESLTRQDIIRRSRKESTSIDPSDGDQLQILLDKIKSGLFGEENTTSKLAFKTQEGRSGFRLELEINLPGGLPPLKWSIHLAAEANTSLTNHLIIPLIEAQHQRAQEIDNLEEIMRQKDHIIQKLLDKLDEQGIQLGQIFPQLATKGRKVDRGNAQDKVKALAKFNFDTWRNDIATDISRDTTHLLDSVFSARAQTLSGNNNNVATVSNIGGWWEDLKGETLFLSGGESGFKDFSSTTQAKDLSKSTPKAEHSVQDEDDFQVQNTPPHVILPPLDRVASKLIDGDIANDEDDVNSQRPKIPDRVSSSPPAVVSPPKKKLGELSRKRQAPKTISDDEDEDKFEPPISATPTPEKESSPGMERVVPKNKGRLGRLGGKKAPSPPPRDPTPPPPAEPEKPKKSKLGKLGGKKKEIATAPASETASPELTPKNDTPAKKKIGIIGSRGGSPTKNLSVPSENTPTRGRSTKSDKELTPTPRETSEERADRRRLELKRELEAKAMAPVKKKRKF